MFKKKYNLKGFTIMEVIVSMAIFSIIITIYLGIFLSTFRANGKVVAKQKVQNEVRYIIDLISKEFRLGTIDYNYYGNNVSNPESVLAIKDISDNNIYFGSSDGVLKIKYSEYDDWHNLSTNNIYVEDLKFYINPTTNPFSQIEGVKNQPLINVFMRVKYNDNGKNDGVIVIQTSISSRQYKE